MASTGWPDLPPDLLGSVIGRLPFPGDRARICAVCRAWRSAARRHVRHQPPWLVLPDGSFCSTGRDGAFFHRIPGLPENTTCLAATDAWLALDCTDDVFRRTPTWDNYCYKTGMFVVARPDVKHRHTYLLHNPFSGETVPLLELDTIIGHVPETFEVRKVLMRSSTNLEDLVAVTTSNWNYNIILCRPGKGVHVLPHFRVIDVAFLGDILYGITSGEELVAFYLGENDDGRPHISRFKLVIMNPMAGYYKKYSWSWPPNDTCDYYEYDSGEKDDNDEDEGSNDENEATNKEKDDNEEEENQEEVEDGEAAASNLEEEEDSSFCADEGVSDNEVKEGDWEVPCEAKDETYTARYLVPSLSGKLLLVRHRYESTLHSGAYTSKVEVFKADVMAGRWIPVTANDGLGEDEALFLSRSFSKCIRAQGDVEKGLVHYTSGCLDDVLDTRSWTIRKMTFRLPLQRDRSHDKWHTWLFPPQVVL